MGVFLILVFILVCGIFAGISAYLKNREIKRGHQKQFQEIRNHNSNTLHLMPITQIEFYKSFVSFICCGGFFFVLILIMTLFTEKEPLSNSRIIKDLLGFVLVYFLLEFIIFYIRLITGHIRGAVVLDDDEENFYAFPTLNSDWNKMEYKVYNKSELIYTIESYGGGKSKGYDAYVFFTKDKKFAFKIGDLKQYRLEEKLKHVVYPDISIPFRYKYHTRLSLFLAIFFSIILVNLLIYFFD